MIPFARILQYGNSIAPKEYDIGSSDRAIFILDKNTNKLYSFGATRGYDSGFNDSSFEPSNALPRLTARNVKRIFGTSQRGGGNSNFFCYESTDGKIMACGVTTSIDGKDSFYPGWTDITNYFSDVIKISDIVDITAWNDLKINLISNDGTLFCIGQNNNAQRSSFGDGTNTDSFNIFRKITTISNVSKAIGNLYLTTNGELYGTGLNGNYQLGNNTTDSTPNLVLIDNSVDDFSCSFTANYLRKGSVLYGFGTTLGSQYGDEFGMNGSTQQTVLKTPTEIRKDVSNFWVIVGNPSCRVRSLDNVMYNTGSNNQGQLGVGNTSGLYVFTEVPGYTSPDVKENGTSACSVIEIDGDFYYCGPAVVFGEPGNTFISKYTKMTNIPFE